MAMNVASSTSMATNLAQKLRVEIRAKLHELTGEHEEELPDYIMVMVANQRTKYQMQDELDFFLKDQTEDFVNWLHAEALRNLGESSGTSKNGKPESKSKHRSKSSKSDKSEKRSSNRSSKRSHNSKELSPSHPQKEPTPPPPQKSSILAAPESKPEPVQISAIASPWTPEPDHQESHDDEEHHNSPPSPVVIINNKAIQNTLSGHLQQTDSDEEIDRLRQTVVASRKVARVAPAQALVSTVARIIHAPQNLKHHQDIVIEYEDADDDEDPVVSDRTLTSVIKVKERQYLPKEQQAPSRLFLKQTSFLRDAGGEHLHAQPVDNDDLRNLLTRKRKREWKREDDRIVLEEPEPEQLLAMNSDFPSQPLGISSAGSGVKTTRFIVTLGGAEKKIRLSKDLEDEEDTRIQAEESSTGASGTSNANQKCRFYPNCRNADCPFIHELDDQSKVACKWFPNCQFGSSCKYRHPFCKFNLSCSKPSCPYKHSSGQRFKPTVFGRPPAMARSQFTWTKPAGSSS